MTLLRVRPFRAVALAILATSAVLASCTGEPSPTSSPTSTTTSSNPPATTSSPSTTAPPSTSAPSTAPPGQGELSPEALEAGGYRCLTVRDGSTDTSVFEDPIRCRRPDGPVAVLYRIKPDAGPTENTIVNQYFVDGCWPRGQLAAVYAPATGSMWVAVPAVPRVPTPAEIADLEARLGISLTRCDD